MAGWPFVPYEVDAPLADLAGGPFTSDEFLSMPTVVITTEPLFHAAGPHIDQLQKEGFEVRFPATVPLQTEQAWPAARQ